MTELVQLIVRGLVDNPDEIEIESREDGDQTILELRVARPDLGKVIGKQGRTARSIRTLLAAAGDRDDRDYVLDILD